MFSGLEKYMSLAASLERQLLHLRAMLEWKDEEIRILRERIRIEASKVQHDELLLQEIVLSQGSSAMIPPGWSAIPSLPSTLIPSIPSPSSDMALSAAASSFSRELQHTLRAGVATDEVRREAAAGTADDTADDWRSSQRTAALLALQRHQNRTCSPCSYFASKVGCALGLSCSYCHEPHEGERPEAEMAVPRQLKSKDRPPKPIRDKCKALAREIIACARGTSAGRIDPALAEVRINELLQGSSDPVTLQFAHNIMRAFIKSEAEAAKDSASLHAPHARPSSFQAPAARSSSSLAPQVPPHLPRFLKQGPLHVPPSATSQLDHEMTASGAQWASFHI